MHELGKASGKLGVADLPVLVLVEVGEDNVRVFIGNGQARAKVPQLLLHDVSLACECTGKELAVSSFQIVEESKENGYVPPPPCVCG